MKDINDNHRVGGSTVIHKSISITLCSEGRKEGNGERKLAKNHSQNGSWKPHIGLYRECCSAFQSGVAVEKDSHSASP